MSLSIISTHPILSSYWHPTKNAFSISKVSSGSSAEVWWQCTNGHEWKARIYNMAKKKANHCPVCTGQQVCSGVNDLATTHPALVSQWHPDNEKKITEVTPGSSYKARWICAEGHSWSTPVYHRTKQGTPGCPYCSGRFAIPGVNDLATTHPTVAVEWHPTKNDALPQEVKPKSNRKVWWLGSCGHEWVTTVANRTAGKGCPFCRGVKVQADVNSFKVTHPELASFWADENTLKPTEVSAGSKNLVTWKQNCGHTFNRSVKMFVKSQNCPYCGGAKALPGFNDYLTVYPALLEEWHPTLNQDLIADNLRPGSDTYVWWKCAEGHEWRSQVKNRPRTGCPVCALSKNTSKAEEELVRFIQSLFPEAAPSNAVIPPYHLDCYVPEKQIAVEFNGIYWHSEKIRSDKNYHFNKWKACKDKGIQLIQIWEDDWNQNPDLVKSMLQHKLGKTPGERIFARNTQIITPTPQQTERFLATNHIQGAVAGSIRVGLQEGLQLVAVMVLKKEGDSLNLLRYATSGAVVGGFTKLLRYVEKTVHPTSIYTFSDNTVSDGGLYEKNGFTIASRLPPDYMYVVKNRRRHKFGYRLKRFRNDPELQYVDGYTEKQLAELNGLVRIWDAGKTKWVKHVHANKEVIMTGKGSEEASEAGKKLSYSDSKKEKSKASKTLNDHKKKSR